MARTPERPDRLDLAAAAAVLAIWAAASAGPVLFLSARGAVPLLSYTELGQALLHRVAVDAPPPAYHMPLASWLAAWLFGSGSPARVLAVSRALAAVAVLLVAALGTLLGSAAGGLIAAAALVLFPRTWFAHTGYVQFVYSLFLLAAACVLAWRARAPSPRRSALAALALGATLLFRSPLCLFPPLLAAAEAFGRRRFRDAWILLIVPYLFLAPWIATNWTVERRFIPFEDGEAAGLIVQGARGVVMNREAEWKWPSLVGSDARMKDLTARRTDALASWAVRETGEHPWRYAASCLRRLLFALSQRPLIAALAAAGFLLSRRRPGFGAVGLLCAYFIGIHCLVSVNEGYFRPVWPLLAALGAAGLGAALKKGLPESTEAEAARWARGVLLAALAALAALCWRGEILVARYGAAARRRAPASQAAWDEAFARAPDDAWLNFKRGQRLLRVGDPAGALKSLERCAPETEPERALWLAWARSLAGPPGTPFAWTPPADFGPAYPEDPDLMRALVRLRARDAAGVRDNLRSALGARERNWTNLTFGPAPEPSVEMRPYAVRLLAERLTWLTDGRPASERAALAKELAALAPAEAGAPLAVSLESLAAARGAPRLSAARPPAPPARPGKDQPTPDRIAFGFIEAADGAASKGRKSEAAALLEKALAAGPGPDAARRAAAVYGGPLGEPREALRIVAPLNAGSRRAVDWLDQASWEESAGDRPAALASLSRAETCRPSPEERRRLALGFQRSGRAARSLEILKALCAEQPSRPDLLRDKGIAESLAGDQAAALADLRAAVGLDPALLSAHLSLGTLLERKGDLRGALQAFERGSAAPKAGADEEALRPLLKEGAAAAAARLRN